MNTTDQSVSPTQSDSIDRRLSRLERSNARWRAAAIAALAGGIGLLIGGAGQPRAGQGYQYMATDDTIYRVTQDGRFEYIKFENGFRSPDGYFNWGQVRIDNNRRYTTKPQP